MGAKVLAEGRRRALNSEHRGICKYYRQDPRTFEISQPNNTHPLVEKRGQNVERNWCHPRLSFRRKSSWKIGGVHRDVANSAPSGNKQPTGGCSGWENKWKMWNNIFPFEGLRFRGKREPARAYHEFSNLFFSRAKRPAPQSYPAFSTYFHAHNHLLSIVWRRN